MQVNGASRTALSAARHRAAHQLLDAGWVFRDPLAVPILGERDDQILDGANQPGRQAMRFFIAARSRFSEDAVAAAVARGTRQLVALGAGLDTFAYRNPYPQLRVFEVDGPGTQDWKRSRLAAAGVVEPDSVRYISIDFEQQDLRTTLAGGGVDLDQPYVASWLGVVVYLAADTVRATLQLVGATPGAEIVFDYSEPPETMPMEQQLSHRFRAARVAALGEPWTTYFTSAALHDLLGDAGFDEIDDVDAVSLAERYLGRPVLRRSRSGAHVVRARRT